MPAQGRPTAAPILPAVDDATVPFSALFDTKNGFDPRTVEATAQLAHRSYFRTADGRRFLVESVPSDTDPVADSNGTHNHRPPLARAATTSPAASPPPTPSSTHARPSAAQTFGTLLRNSLRRRPGSHAIPNPPTSPRTSRAAQSPQPAPASPVSPIMAAQAAGTQEVTNMMSRLNVNRFSATPLFYNSDGGVQAAEALTDPSYSDSPTGGSSPDPPASAVPASQQHHYHIHSPNHDNPVIYGLQPGPDPDTIPPHMAGLSGGHITNFDYVHYTAQANFQVQRQQQSGATASGAGFPSLMEMSSPIPSPQRDSEFSPLDGGAPMHDPEKEFFVGGNGAGGGGGSDGYYRSPSVAGSAASGLQVPPPWAGGPHANYVNIGRSYSSGEVYDTLTPVVVHPATITHAPSHSSDGASTTRDNVMPGEQVLFDGPVKSAQTLNAPIFVDGQLKVFRNTLSNDLRFFCRVGHESETYWIKGINAHLVPVYAYDPRFPNVVYIRDNESEKGNVYMQPTPGNGRPSGIYQFPLFRDLCEFQAKLTSEKVVLDITSAKFVRLNRDSRSSDTYYTVRLQIWHEAELRRGTTSDVASFVTAGTALSGPLRERLVASSSRLIIYLGRLGEYITLFATDDIEVKSDLKESPTLVQLRPRKAGSFSRRGSRWAGIKAHIERKGNFEMAGLEIHGQATDPDVDATYDLFKTIEIEFENGSSQDMFIRKWDEVMKERRAQRIRLNQIQEEMGNNVFTGPIAREIW
ncbi:hypothetical protein QBC39DRAFT_258081 [Podospora conica]|nr:hypothetical protein QBC39DRAFT_258081 [Schizothecium conicum]